MKIWDILAGGRLVATFSNHQKTITSLCFDGQFTRLLSASLDRYMRYIRTTLDCLMSMTSQGLRELCETYFLFFRHVKIYDVKDYKVVHSMHYPSPILCMGVSVSHFRF